MVQTEQSTSSEGFQTLQVQSYSKCSLLDLIKSFIHTFSPKINFALEVRIS